MGHRQYCQKFLADLKVDLPPTDLISPIQDWDKPYSLEESSLEDGDPSKADFSDYHVYTDGSLFDGKVGAGVHIVKCELFSGETLGTTDEAFHLGDRTTVFQSEVYAIKRAAGWITANCSYKRVNIHVDSRAALWAVTGHSIKSRVVKEATEALREAAANNFLRLRWVKAHVGHTGNEIADELAKKGAVGIPTPEADSPLAPQILLKRTVAEGVGRLWHGTWADLNECRQTKHWFPAPNTLVSAQLLRLGRHQLSAMVQLITGHNFLNRHRALLREVEDPTCRLCLEDEESSWHIIAECPALARLRYSHWGQVMLTHTLQWSVKQVTSFLREASIGDLLLTGEE